MIFNFCLPVNARRPDGLRYTAYIKSTEFSPYGHAPWHAALQNTIFETNENSRAMARLYKNIF